MHNHLIDKMNGTDGPGGAVARDACAQPDETSRQKVRGAVDAAQEVIARCWPLGTFIYRNPLQGLEYLPFEEAVREGQRLFGGVGYPNNEAYRAIYRACIFLYLTVYKRVVAFFDCMFLNLFF